MHRVSCLEQQEIALRLQYFQSQLAKFFNIFGFLYHQAISHYLHLSCLLITGTEGTNFTESSLGFYQENSFEKVVKKSWQKVRKMLPGHFFLSQCVKKTRSNHEHILYTYSCFVLCLTDLAR